MHSTLLTGNKEIIFRESATQGDPTAMGGLRFRSYIVASFVTRIYDGERTSQ